ncbi:MAG: PAS domain-containing protein, partial [Myxococcales bacterium]
RDTTDRRKAFEDMRGADAPFQLLVDHAPDGLALVRNGRILHANPALARLAGASDPGQLSGAALADLFAAVDRVAIARLVSVHVGQPPSQSRLRLRGGGGSEIEVDVAAHPAPFEGGSAVVLAIRKPPTA